MIPTSPISSLKPQGPSKSLKRAWELDVPNIVEFNKDKFSEIQEESKQYYLNRRTTIGRTPDPHMKLPDIISSINTDFLSKRDDDKIGIIDELKEIEEAKEGDESTKKIHKLNHILIKDCNEDIPNS